MTVYSFSRISCTNCFLLWTLLLEGSSAFSQISDGRINFVRPLFLFSCIQAKRSTSSSALQLCILMWLASFVAFLLSFLCFSSNVACCILKFQTFIQKSSDLKQLCRILRFQTAKWLSKHPLLLPVVYWLHLSWINSENQSIEINEFLCYVSEKFELGSPFSICTLRLYVGGTTTYQFFKTDHEPIRHSGNFKAWKS